MKPWVWPPRLLPCERPYLEKVLGCEGILTWAEALWILRTVRELASATGSARCVEIGSYRGRSTVAAAVGLQAAGGRGSVTAIDPLQGDDRSRFRANLRRADVDLLVRHVPKLSWDSVDDVAVGVDFLFIDGDHSYQGVRRDLELFGPKVRGGGLIAFHDVSVSTLNLFDPNFSTGWTPVRRCFREGVVASPDWEQVGCAGSIGYAVRSESSLPPSFGRRLAKRAYFDVWLFPRHLVSNVLFRLRHSPPLEPAVESLHRVRRWLTPRPGR